MWLKRQQATYSPGQQGGRWQQGERKQGTKASSVGSMEPRNKSANRKHGIEARAAMLTAAPCTLSCGRQRRAGQDAHQPGRPPSSSSSTSSPSSSHVVVPIRLAAPVCRRRRRQVLALVDVVHGVQPPALLQPVRLHLLGGHLRVCCTRHRVVAALAVVPRRLPILLTLRGGGWWCVGGWAGGWFREGPEKGQRRVRAGSEQGQRRVEAT